MPRKMSTEKPKNAKRSFKLFISSLRPFKFAIIFPLVFAVVANVLNLFGPKILGNMTNSAVDSLSTTGSLDLATIKTSAIQLIAIYLLVAVLSYFESFLLARATAFYTKNLREKIIEKIAEDNQTSYYLTEKGHRLQNILYELAIFNLEEEYQGEELKKIKKEFEQLKYCNE